MNDDVLLSAPLHVREEVARIKELHRLNALALTLAVRDDLKRRSDAGEKGLPSEQAAIQAYIQKAMVRIDD